MDQFPGNSHTARVASTDTGTPPSETTSEPKKAGKVTDGRVYRKRKPLGSRLKNMFVDDGGDFITHLVEKVIVPMVKEMVLSAITQSADGFRQGLERQLFGPDDQGRRNRPTSYGSSRTRVNYNGYSNGNRYNTGTTMRRDSSTRPPPNDGVIRRSNRVEGVLVETRENAELVLDDLNAVIDSVGHCSVGDFYAAVGLRPSTTDEEWGWNSLRSAEISKVGTDEFLITMPRPLPIE